MNQTVLRLFLDADLHSQHDGLSKLAKKDGIDLQTLKPGEHVVFINVAKNKIKIFSSDKVLSYYKNGNRQIRVDIIDQMVKTFGGNASVYYTRALREKLKKELLS